jgi:hypothetical protein
MRLPDGSVIPSHLVKSGELGFHPNSFSNSVLRVGTIVDVYSTDDKQNLNGKVAEYDVLCTQLEGNRGQTSLIYPNCISTSAFGSSDYLNYSLRKGAVVLVLCVDGNTARGVILGAYSANNTKSSLDGSFLDFNFNGINAQVKNDGSFTFSQTGAHDEKSLTSLPLTSQVTFDTTGSITVTNGLGQQIFLDSVTKEISVISDSGSGVNEAATTWTTKATQVAVESSTTMDVNAPLGFNTQIVNAAVSVATPVLQVGQIVPSAGIPGEPMVMGAQLQLALADLIATVFVANSATFVAGVAIHPNVLAAMSAWIVKWIASGALVSKTSSVG